MATRVSTQAIVVVTVEVPTGTYGAECTMAQILEQAAQEGRNKVSAIIHGKGRVVGHPIVRTVTTLEATNGQE